MIINFGLKCAHSVTERREHSFLFKPTICGIIQQALYSTSHLVKIRVVIFLFELNRMLIILLFSTTNQRLPSLSSKNIINTLSILIQNITAPVLQKDKYHTYLLYYFIYGRFKQKAMFATLSD